MVGKLSTLFIGTLLGAMAVLLGPSGGLGADPYGSAPDGVDRFRFMGYNAYFGELHQHSGYSPDGCGLPEDVITTAMCRGNDFLALTDHHNSFYFPEIGSIEKGCRIAETDPHKWETLGELAERYTSEGSFIVFRGYEWTRLPGHINVFNSETYGTQTDLDEFYSWLAGQPEDVFAHFCHPLPHDWAGIGDFEDFAFFPPVAPKMCFIELAHSPPFFAFYPRALAKEWQVSGVGYGDGHHAVGAGSRHYGVFAPEMTRSSLMDALRSRRTFGNTDGNLAVALSGNGQWMGTPTCAESIDFQAYAADTTGDLIVDVQLVGGSGVIESHQPMSNPAECTFTVADVQPGDFFYLHVVDSNGDEGWSGSIIRPRYRRLQTNPATLRFSFETSAVPPSSQSFVVEANDGGDVPWHVSPTEEWIEVLPAEGQHLPATISVTVSPDGLASGLETSCIVIKDAQGAYLSAMEGIQAEVGSPEVADLTLQPRFLTTSARLSRPVFSGTLTVSTSDNDLAWFAAPSVPWLSLSPCAGSGSGAIEFCASLEGYRPDAYHGHIVAMAGSQIRVSDIRCDLLPDHARLLVRQQDVDGYTGASDSFLETWYPDTAHGDEGVLRVRSFGLTRSLIRFDLSDVPPDSGVYTATLSLYARESSTHAALLLSAHELLKPWDEATVTWDDCRRGIPWSEGGGGAPDQDAARYPATVFLGHETPRWYCFDITLLARKWVARPEANFGIAILGEAGASTAFTFYSSQAPSHLADLRPRVSIIYGDPLPTATPTTTALPAYFPLVLLE